ncbi:Aspartate/glutamate leucyltransferase [Gammaproteobacteria bacterium]
MNTSTSPTNLRRLSLFIAPSHPCSYLPGQKSNSLLADPREQLDHHLYSALVEQGFRRSGSLVYRPQCQGCRACIPVRIPVALFQPKRSQRRIWAANQDLRVRPTRPALRDEQFHLFKRYISARHAGSGMDDVSMIDYLEFLSSAFSTGFYEIRLGEQLCAVSVLDHLTHGLSAVYTFFDPHFSHRSLGVFTILWAIEECRRHNLPYLYIGYWIADCQKMSYKDQYRPLEVYLDNQWVVLRKGETVRLADHAIVRSSE